jgi:AGCS family alanine or glycine:cation symporter
MWVSAFFGMMTKFAEVSLAVKYREKTADGWRGGPMYYMKNRLKTPWLAVIFAIATLFCAFGTGGLPQVNSISNSMFQTFGVPHILTGGVLTVLLALIIIGGIRRIAKVTSVLVPFMAIVYLIGSLGVLIYNWQNILPAFVSIFTDVFTGTAAVGGFAGAGFAYAFNRGVNRGLFSNEAGQGSAPIAHAAARTNEPVSEGAVALLEPFIDTVIICMLTGLTLLSSGVWYEKHENRFQFTDMEILAQTYINDETPIHNHIRGIEPLKLFSGRLEIADGIITTPVSIIHARSLAENIRVSMQGKPFTGFMEVTGGRVSENGCTFDGKSLLHSAPLSTVAFTNSYFGTFGKYIVTIGLLLFAFSTTVSWSYYGDRAVIFLGGLRWIIPFRIIFCAGYFIASFTDTTIIWTISGITIALMTLPNLFGILFLHREVREMEQNYRKKFNEEHPDGKI